ncbi:hypothetical protein [Lyngbya confervoides]|uniref:Uncharacterized protein n=1 Tax=Lyngbya confervoides BDU141951 TaxID=1574623 RepID=A0ABD4T2K7_9CYAN|nr:hypothetical protein [Lyngbya confervoides]MCM1982967.1 hypothetical protein [Lyngbya confervoides BDU141951]
MISSLIITVGTRQVGWRSPDGIVRSLGADAARGVPSHVDELYQELGIERKSHEAAAQWSVRDLGERLYLHCQIENDFSPVVLLLDAEIIAKEAARDLQQVILWGTQQPDTVPWQYRRMDTLWLAELMAGAIRERYEQLTVEVWAPLLEANDHLAIIEEIETKLINHAEQGVGADQELTFLIQNRGSTPAIASALEISAAAIVRQYGVKLLIPKEPRPAFANDDQGRASAQVSTFYRSMPLGKYFWPIEKPGTGSVAWVSVNPFNI